MDPISLFMLGSAVLGVSGNLFKGFASERQAQQQAALQRQQAQDVLTKAAFDIDVAERNFTRHQGTVQAKTASSGITQGSFYDVLADDAMEAKVEQKRISYNATAQANAILKGASFTEQAGNDALVGSFFGAASSAVSAYAPSFKHTSGVTISQGGQ